MAAGAGHPHPAAVSPPLPWGATPAVEFVAGARLSRLFLVLALVGCLLACVSHPAPADWQLASSAAARRFQSAWLDGNERLAASELAHARSALAHTGRHDLRARLELLACALRVASLDFDDCPGFLALAPDAGDEAQAYAAYLAGQQAHRPDGEEAKPSDPLSRLVTAAVLLRTNQLNPTGVAEAVDTASAQGWRRPLLAWLGLQQRLALARGEALAAARIARRIDLVLEQGPAQ